MKRILLILMVLVGLTAQAQQTFNPTIRLLNVKENLANDKVLTINNTTKEIEWINMSDITPDMTAYYTADEIDAFLLTKQDELIAGDNVTFDGNTINVTIPDLNTSSSAELIAGTETEGKLQSAVNLKTWIESFNFAGADDVGVATLDDVVLNGNTTTKKITGQAPFVNDQSKDFAQIADVRTMGYRLVFISSSQEIELRDYNDVVLNKIDVSSLSTGDLVIEIDETDVNNPEIVFKQDGEEVGRIPASTLLSGVPRTLEFTGGKLILRDGQGVNVSEVNLQPTFDLKADKATMINTGTALTGGGDLSANRTIDLSAASKTSLSRAETAWGRGDFRDYGLGITYGWGNQKPDLTSLGSSSTVRSLLIDGTFFSIPLSHKPVGFVLKGSSDNRWSWSGVTDFGPLRMFIANTSNREEADVAEVWHSKNLTKLSDLDNDLIVVGNYYNKNESNLRFVRVDGVQSVNDTKTFTSSPVVPNATIDSHATNLGQVNGLIAQTDLKKAVANGNTFDGVIINKYEGNVGAGIQTNDAVTGWINDTYYLEGAIYKGGSQSSVGSYSGVARMKTGMNIVKRDGNSANHLQTGDRLDGFLNANYYVDGIWLGVDNPSQLQIEDLNNYTGLIKLN